jgi:hypothetical protein
VVWAGTRVRSTALHRRWRALFERRRRRNEGKEAERAEQKAKEKRLEQAGGNVGQDYSEYINVRIKEI